MRRELLIASVLIALAGRVPCSADDSGPVLSYRAEAWDSAAAATDATRAALASVLVKRCTHMGFAGVTADVAKDDGTVAVRIPTLHAADVPEIRHVIERRGDVEFRVRATEAMEDEYRDRRLQADTPPPPGFAWRADEAGPLQMLVSVPELPFVAKLAEIAAKEPKDEAQKAALDAARTELEKVRAESVFTNADIGAASVRRALSTIGAQALMHVDVVFEFREERKAAFEKFTGANVGRAMCIVVEGKVHTSPVIKSALPGMGLIRAPGTGYTDVEAREMAAILECGPLPLKLVPAKEK